MAVVLGFAPAQAQTPVAPTVADSEPILLDEFKVSEVRASLIGAQEAKQNSLQFVDSIVAQDIGKLPDNSVADALQRIPGIQVGRGSEVGLVLIRGLPNLATTLNGHEIFTGTGRGVALQDIPAELVAGVDVFKSPAPEQTEGGIAGLIDVRLRKPLNDFKDGLQFAGGGRGIYGEVSEKTSYVGSALVSNKWKLANEGQLGALYSFSYQKNHYIDQTVFNFLFEPVSTTIAPGQTSLQLPLTQGSLVIPDQRRRLAHNFSLQWKPTKEVEVYTDFLYTAYRDTRQVYFNIGFPRFGAFTAATTIPGTDIPTSLTSENNFHLTSMQAFQDKTDGYQSVVGAKWQRDALKVSTEFIYNWNSVKHRALIVDTRFGPPTPATFRFGFNNDGQADQRITGQDVASANNYYLWGLFDNRDYSTSDQKAVKLDAEYMFRDGFITSVKTGIRLTDRDARFRGTSVNDIAPAGAVGGDRFHPNVPRVSSITGFSAVSPQGPIDDYGVPRFVTANPDFLYNNAAGVRQLFGLPTRDPDFNPTLGFTDNEETQAVYAQANYSTELGGRRLEGLFGIRAVQTDQKLVGYRQDGSAINTDEDQVDVLPMAAARLKLRDDLLMRASLGRTITRPNFADLNPATTLNAPTTTGGGAGTGSGGNPDLQSVTSDNLDVSLEYYFAKASYVSLAGFYRKIDGYVQSFAALETVGSTQYIVVRPRNAGEGELQGFEFSYQHFPEFFPPVLKGLGWHTNFTYIDGDQDTADTRPGAATGARVRQAYAQVSRTSYNIIGIYERGKFSTRLAYNWRGKFTDTFDGPNAPGSPLRRIEAKARDFLDFSASYKITDKLTATFDITNALNSEYQDYFGDPRFARDTRAYDRTFALGVRYRY
jgi:iron complex outermembrane recepter protein